MRMILAATCLTLGVGGLAHAQQMTEPVSNDDYMKRLIQVARPQIVSEATVVRMQTDTMRTLKKGTNAWTCMEASRRSHVPGPERHGMRRMRGRRNAPATDKTGFDLHAGR